MVEMVFNPIRNNFIILIFPSIFPQFIIWFYK